MAVYAVTYLITKETSDGNSNVKPYMNVVTLAGPAKSLDAIAYIEAQFQDSDHMKDGWQLIGEPVILDLHAGLWEEFAPYLNPSPQQKSPRDHLRLVE